MLAGGGLSSSVVVTHMVTQQFAYAEQRAVFASVRAEFLPARCRVSNLSLPSPPPIIPPSRSLCLIKHTRTHTRGQTRQGRPSVNHTIVLCAHLAHILNASSLESKYKKEKKKSAGKLSPSSSPTELPTFASADPRWPGRVFAAFSSFSRSLTNTCCLTTSTRPY